MKSLIVGAAQSQEAVMNLQPLTFTKPWSLDPEDPKTEPWTTLPLNLETPNPTWRFR